MKLTCSLTISLVKPDISIFRPKTWALSTKDFSFKVVCSIKSKKKQSLHLLIHILIKRQIVNIMLTDTLVRFNTFANINE